MVLNLSWFVAPIPKTVSTCGPPAHQQGFAISRQSYLVKVSAHGPCRTALQSRRQAELRNPGLFCSCMQAGSKSVSDLLQSVTELSLTKNVTFESELTSQSFFYRFKGQFDTFVAQWIFLFKGIIYPYWAGLYNAITHKPIELESCSNLRRMPQVFQFALRKSWKKKN